MSPVRLVVLGVEAASVPVVDEPFWIGRDPGCDLCLWDLRISRKHVRLARAHGEYVLTSEGRHGVWVNGSRVPLLPLRHGDRIDLTPPDSSPPVTLRFENELEGTYVPDGSSLSAAWLDRERASNSSRSIPGFDVVGPIDPARTDVLAARKRGGGGEAVIRVFPAVPGGPATDSWLRLLTALAGATHPSLAHVLEGGLLPVESGGRRWIALELVTGRPASVRISEGPQPLVTVCRRARSIAAGLHLLHSRGVVHGGVCPSNLILKVDGNAVLIGLGRTHVRRDGAFRLAGASGEGAYVAPEAAVEGALATPPADVYGLAALTQAMATGRAPFAGDGVTAPRGPRLSSDIATGPLPAPLEDVLARALSEDVTARPTAEDFGQVLAYVEATLAKAVP